MKSEEVGRERIITDMYSPLIDKSKEFALQIIKVCNSVKSAKKESVLTNQLIRSGTSIGANIREAFYAHGKADFIAKLQIALKECSESEYWLELLIESGYYDDSSIIGMPDLNKFSLKGLYNVNHLFLNNTANFLPSPYSLLTASLRIFMIF